MPSNCQPVGSAIECTYPYTGGTQSFTVPASVSSITVDLYGAGGGSVGFPAKAAGGKGAHVIATLPVTAGTTYAIEVGAGGRLAEHNLTRNAYNGGGDGQDDDRNASAGGGGASDLRTDGGALGDRLLVAGGGGGAAFSGEGDSYATIGGGDGGDSGNPGHQGQDAIAAPDAGEGGGAGTQTAGGSGGSSSSSTIGSATIGGSPGGDGSLGTGGDAGDDGFLGSSGGGGGGGYYGGGGGGGGAGNDASILTGSASGGGGGGGGSSYVTPLVSSSTVTEGVQSDDGKVVITYADPDAPAKTSQSIAFDPASTGTVGGSQSLSATASSDLAVAFSVDATSDAGVCSIAADGSTLNFLAAGTCKVNADQAGDSTYNAAPQVTRSISVSAAKTPQVITFANPGSQNFGTSPTLTATSDSGLTVTFTSSTTGVCTITSGGSLTTVSTGTCTINADQAGNAAYEAATQVSRSFAINAVAPGAPTIGTATPGNESATVSFTAPASSGGSAITGYTATSSPDNITGTCASSPCTISNLTNGIAYTLTVTATNSAGTGSASSASNSATPRGPQTITFANPGAQNFGTTPTLTATASSTLTPTFTSSRTEVCTITSGGALTFLTTGTCTINADQVGNAAYEEAPQVSRSFTVNPVVAGAPTIGTAKAGNASATVTFTPPTNTGGAPVTFAAVSDPHGVIGTCSASPCTVSGLSNGTTYVFRVAAVNSAGEGPPSAPSNSVTPRGTFSPGPSPSISGLRRVGATLTANIGSPSPTPTAVSYRWYVNGSASSNTGKSLKLPAAYAGKRIQVRVTIARFGYVTATKPSAATAPISNLQAKTISMELNDYSVYRGQRVLAEIELLARGESWKIVLDGKTLAAGVANSRGVAVKYFTVPASATRGERILRAYGAFNDRTDPDRITVR